MKSSRIVFMFGILAMLCISLGIAKAQEAADNPVTIADILKKAKCPLTDEQTKKLAELNLNEGREVFRSLYGMFDEPQNKALMDALGVREGRNDRPDRPRYLMQVVIFEKAKCPLTEKQLKALKELPNERGSFEKAREIYTEKQNEELQKIFRRRNRQ